MDRMEMPAYTLAALSLSLPPSGQDLACVRNRAAHTLGTKRQC